MCGLSLGAASLLLILIQARRRGRGRVAVYLVPPVVAVLAFALFGEQLSSLQVAGMAVAATGVPVASRD